MANKKFIFGLCSSEIARHLEYGSHLSYESSMLLNEAKKIFDDVVEIHPRQVRFKFIRSTTKPQIIMDDKDLSNLSCLVVRGTAGYEQSISVLVHALKLCGCCIFDPIHRFSGETASKLLTTIDRYEKRVGSDSYYAFSLSQALKLVDELADGGVFPLLSKPITGKKGKGVLVLSSREQAKAFAREFFQKYDSKDIPLFFQPYIEFESEYRVMLVGDHFIGMAKKLRKKGNVVANAAAGATFVPAHDSEIVQFVIEHVNLEGILGVDVARDSAGQLHIIEANRAPLWKEFERVTGINVAKEIVTYARQKCG